MKITVTLVLVLVPLPSAWAQNNNKCTHEEAIKAEAGLALLRTWLDLYQSYKTYGQCDDGSIGEGYSDVVVRLLTNNWESINGLNKLISRDKSFEHFVLRHLDQLMSRGQAQAIRENAISRCAQQSRRLCRAIIRKLDQVGREK